MKDDQESVMNFRANGADSLSRPAVKNFSNPEASTTTLTSSSTLIFSNTLEYSRQTLRRSGIMCQ